MRTTVSNGFDNVDVQVTEGFGDEWSRFPQDQLSDADKEKVFADYFSIFPWALLPEGGGIGADLGCGSGRWATLMAPKAAKLHCLDASSTALAVARKNVTLACNNLPCEVEFHHASVGDPPFPDASLDFAYSLGVLHHIPDTEQAIVSISAKLKKGAPFLVYLYYAFDNRPSWYRGLWKASEIFRWGTSRLPFGLRFVVSQIFAAVIYWPFARFGLLLERLQMLPAAWPLGYYRDKAFYVMRTDALDRFGTRLEKRFTRRQIRAMLEAAEFGDIRFSEQAPFWVAVGIKK